MEPQHLIDLVQSYCGEINEPYVLRQQVLSPSKYSEPMTPQDGAWYVLDKYLARPKTLGMSTARKERVIRELHNGWRECRTSEFGCMTIGCSLLLLYDNLTELLKAEMWGFQDILTDDEVIKPRMAFAADVIVRASRWFHTEGWQWNAPQRWVDTFVRYVWGDIEDLIRVEGISEQWSNKPVRKREKPQCSHCKTIITSQGRLPDFCSFCGEGDMSNIYLVRIQEDNASPLNAFFHEPPYERKDGFSGEVVLASLDWNRTEHPDWAFLGISPKCVTKFRVFSSDEARTKAGYRPVLGTFGIWDSWTEGRLQHGLS